MEDLTARMERYFDRLWPICRSIAGPGYRESLDILAEVMPVTRLRFPTKTKVLDWVVPREWEPRDAFFVGPDGVKRCDFKKNNLHLLGYSIPFRGDLTREQLRAHLYSLPEQPDAIPYLTSYYKKRWGFCLTHRELEALPPGHYDVVVDTELRDGHVEVGEAVLPGESEEEILFCSYLCHPSLANNELSGPLALVFLYEALSKLLIRRYTYRFVLAPETIGSVAYLSARGAHLKEHMRAGFLLTCIGDRGLFTLKRSRRADTSADRAAAAVLGARGPFRCEPFDPADGSEDRQYCSPGFDLPFASLMRTMYGRFPEYHTSLDNKNFISFEALTESVSMCLEVARALEANRTWINMYPFGAPQLGRRGLYPSLGSQKTIETRLRAMLWLLNYSDGTNDILAVSEKSKASPILLHEIAEELCEHNLLREKE
jgi:aminopeptidase-like protein